MEDGLLQAEAGVIVACEEELVRGVCPICEGGQVNGCPGVCFAACVAADAVLEDLRVRCKHCGFDVLG